MTYITPTQYNVTGLESLMQYVSYTIPIFVPLLLFGLFMIVLLSSYFAQRYRDGRGDFLASFVVAGFLTTIVAYLLMLMPGVVNSLTLVVCTIVTVIGVLILLNTEDRY